MRTDTAKFYEFSVFFVMNAALGNRDMKSFGKMRRCSKEVQKAVILLSGAHKRGWEAYEVT